MSLNLEAFTSSQVEHIKNIRKDFCLEPKEKKKGIGGLFKSLSNFRIIQDPFAGMKEVTIYDYLNNLLNFNLIKKNESYHCNLCNIDTLADKVYKIHTLPNNLLFTLMYKQTSSGKHLRLKNFMDLDMKPFINTEFYNAAANPFHLERDDIFKYKLTSLITYSTNEPTRDGYITYVRQKDGTWLRFSKYK